MKGKILIISLIAVFCVFLSACGCSNEEADPVKNPITHETDAGTTTTPDVEDNGKQAEDKDNGSSSDSSNSGSSSKSNGSSSTKSNGGSTNSSSGKNNTTIVTPAPVIQTPEPEQTPTPPRRSSSSNLRVD